MLGLVASLAGVLLWWQRKVKAELQVDKELVIGEKKGPISGIR